MSILAATDANPVGAAALLGFADPDELRRFSELEDAVWTKTSLAPATIEAVRLYSAKIRGCAFCSAVRITAAKEDGLTEVQISQLGDTEATHSLNSEQSAALTLVRHFLRDPRRPDDHHLAKITSTLGTAGVLEVLLSCCAFASADLRIALGENREPNGSGIVERSGNRRPSASGVGKWPRLPGSPLDPDTRLPAISPELAKPIRERVYGLWAGNDMPAELLAACILRSTQLLDIPSTDPVIHYLVPARSARLADPGAVRNWPSWHRGLDRETMSLAEHIWIDPASVDETITAPLAELLGVAAVIRITWDLILIGQLHRLALVLHWES